MKPKWHWSNKSEPERRRILQKMSVGWGKKPITRIGKICLVCGKRFEVKKSTVARRKHCSKECFNKSKKGIIPPNIEQARKNSPIKKGSKNINWKGGMPRPYPDEWNGSLKHRIFARDKGKCQICGKVGKKRSDLICHHIDFNKKNCNTKNIQLLCRSCHMTVHWAKKGKKI